MELGLQVEYVLEVDLLPVEYGVYSIQRYFTFFSNER